MPLPVIADTFRITINWDRSDGVEPRNVFHVSTGSPAPTEEQLGTDLAASFEADMWGSVSDSFVFTSIDVLQLDGVSAGVTTPVGANNTGQGGAGAFVPATALVLSLRTATRGPRGRGRLYLGPVAEADQTDGLYVGGTTRTDIITAWETFAATLDGLSYGAGLVVASYTHATADGVRIISARQVLGTQRRRQDQLV